MNIVIWDYTCCRFCQVTAAPVCEVHSKHPPAVLGDTARQLHRGSETDAERPQDTSRLHQVNDYLLIKLRVKLRRYPVPVHHCFSICPSRRFRSFSSPDYAADKRIVNIMKVDVERNNLQLELIYRKNVDFIHIESKCDFIHIESKCESYARLLPPNMG